MGSIGQSLSFSEHVHVKLNGITKCSLGVKRSKLNFSEQFHVAYQIKGNLECSNMVANILPADCPYTHPLPTLGVESIGLNSTFSEHGHVA